MTMFIKIIGCNVSQIGASSAAPYIVVADNDGRQLRRTAPRSDGFSTWDSQAFMCNDTLQSILLYVYTKDSYRGSDSLVGTGRFDFNQVRGLPYEKINVNVPIVLQNVNTGVITLEAEYNEGQIFIGESSHMDLGSAVYRAPTVAPSLMVAGTNTSTVIQQPVVISQVLTPPTVIAQPQIVVPPPVIAPPIQQTIASVGVRQDGFIPIQMINFHPDHNLFSMWDVHYPESKFNMVQPHLRKVVYRD